MFNPLFLAFECIFCFFPPHNCSPRFKTRVRNTQRRVWLQPHDSQAAEVAVVACMSPPFYAGTVCP